MNQSRSENESNRRDELELHMALLAEHEIMFMRTLILDIAKKLDIQEKDSELDELQKSVAPEEVLDHIKIENDTSDDSHSLRQA